MAHGCAKTRFYGPRPFLLQDIQTKKKKRREAIGDSTAKSWRGQKMDGHLLWKVGQMGWAFGPGLGGQMAKRRPQLPCGGEPSIGQGQSWPKCAKVLHKIGHCTFWMAFTGQWAILPNLWLFDNFLPNPMIYGPPNWTNSSQHQNQKAVT